MNLNLDGTQLTTEELLGLAATSGYDMQGLHNELTALHSANMSRSHLMFITRDARFVAWTEGKLGFGTRLRESEFVEKIADPEIMEFLLTTIKETA